MNNNDRGVSDPAQSSPNASSPACVNCDDRGFTPSPTAYIGLGYCQQAFCGHCPRGRTLFRRWASKPAQRAYAHRIKASEVQRALDLSGLEGRFLENRLEDLRSLPSIHQECARYVRLWPARKAQGAGYYFWGNVGAGKTHAAAALANELIRTHFVEALFLNLPEAVSRVKRTFDDPTANADARLFDRMKAVELLIIDDLGVEKPSNWLDDQLYQIIDYRWRNRKPIIVTSNQSLDDLSRRYRPQIASRLRGCCRSVRFTDPDRRTPGSG